MTLSLIPMAQPVPGESGQTPRVQTPRFLAQAPREVVFTASGVDAVLEHGLGRIPAGWMVVGLSAAITVYNGSASPSEDYLVLRASGAGTAWILVL